MLSVYNILKLQSQRIKDWHTNINAKELVPPFDFIEENNLWNFKLWHEEDIARITHIDPLRIVEAKRNIDKFNQARNNAMEKIDEWVLNYVSQSGHASVAKLHSETPGMMIDRLSIMALKKYHMQEEAEREDASDEHRATCAQRVSVLSEQMEDLANNLADVFEQLQNGTLQFKVYRQYKMYNDPNLNPQLYKNKVS